jgi:hypothetical protein
MSAKSAALTVACGAEISERGHRKQMLSKPINTVVGIGSSEGPGAVDLLVARETDNGTESIGGQETREGKKMTTTTHGERQERALDRVARDFAKKKRVSLSDKEFASVREQLRVDALYPGEHVVFRDHYEGKGDSLHLARREILFHSKHHSEAQQFFQNLPLADKANTCLDYAESKASRIR